MIRDYACRQHTPYLDCQSRLSVPPRRESDHLSRAPPGPGRYDAVIVEARLLEADRVFRLAGSDDPALQVLLAHVGPAVVSVGTRAAGTGYGVWPAAAPTAL